MSMKEPCDEDLNLTEKVQFYQSVLALLEGAVRGEDVLAGLAAKIGKLEVRKRALNQSVALEEKRSGILEMAVQNPLGGRPGRGGERSVGHADILEEMESEYKKQMTRDESEEYQLKRLEVGLCSMEKEIGRLVELKKKQGLMKELEIEHKRWSEISRSNALRSTYLAFNHKRERERKRALLERLRQEGVEVEDEEGDGTDEEVEEGGELLEAARELELHFSNSRPTASTALPAPALPRDDAPKHASEGQGQAKSVLPTPRINRNNTLDASLSISMQRADNQPTHAPLVLSGISSTEQFIPSSNESFLVIPNINKRQTSEGAMLTNPAHHTIPKSRSPYNQTVSLANKEDRPIPKKINTNASMVIKSVNPPAYSSLQHYNARTNSFEGTGHSSDSKSYIQSTTEGGKMAGRNMTQKSNWQSAFPNFKQNKREGGDSLHLNKEVRSEANSPVERMQMENAMKSPEKVRKNLEQFRSFIQNRKLQEGNAFDKQNYFELQVIEEERNTINNDKFNNQKGHGSSMRDSEDCFGRENQLESPDLPPIWKQVPISQTNLRSVEVKTAPRKVSLEDRPRIVLQQVMKKEPADFDIKKNSINAPEGRGNGINRNMLQASLKARQSLSMGRRRASVDPVKEERSLAQQTTTQRPKGIFVMKAKVQTEDENQKSPALEQVRRLDSEVRSPYKKSTFLESSPYPPFEGVMRTIRKISCNLDSPAIENSRSRHDLMAFADKEKVSPPRSFANTISMIPDRREIQREMVTKRFKGQNYSGDLEDYRSIDDSFVVKSPTKRRRTVGGSRLGKDLFSKALKENKKRRLTDIRQDAKKQKNFSVLRVSKGENCIEPSGPGEAVLPQLQADENSSSSVHSISLERAHPREATLKHPQTLVRPQRKDPSAQGKPSAQS
jgi:hypothetical protein